MYQQLSGTVTVKVVTTGFQRLPLVSVIVDLAVQHSQHGPFPVDGRLLGRINEAERHPTQRDARVFIEVTAFVVPRIMPQTAGHVRKQSGKSYMRCSTGNAKDSRHSTTF